MERRNLAPLLILIVTALIAFGLYEIKFGDNFLSRFFSQGGVQATLQSATTGEVVEGFPRELILPKDAKVVTSSNYDIKAQDVSVLSVVYDSATSIADLFAAYSNYFTDNGYKIVLSNAKLGSTQLAAKGSRYTVAVRTDYLNAKQNRTQLNVTIPNPQK